MKLNGSTCQVECADLRITLRLSNKVREMEAKGYVIGRAPVAPKRKDVKYWIVSEPKEKTSAEARSDFEATLPNKIDADNDTEVKTNQQQLFT